MQLASKDLQIKLTVTSDEHPELHRVLKAISEPRRRTRRLKELAAMGLLVERSGTFTLAAPASLEPATEHVPEIRFDAVSMALWDDKAG